MGGASSGQPLLSVCTPSYNYAPFLQQCLDSVWAQTFTAFERIIVDDASTDGSVDLIRSCADARLRFHAHRQRLGAVATWNQCLELARGVYVAFLCADDFFLPDKLAAQVSCLARDPALGLIHTDGYWADEAGQTVQLFSEVFPPALRAYLASDHTAAAPLELRYLAGGYNYIHLSNAVFRRDAALRVGGFDPACPYAADWDLWLRLAAQHAVAYIARPLAVYRRHRRNLTLSMQAAGQDWADWYSVMEAAFQRWPPAAGDPTSIRRQAYRVIREQLMARVHAQYAVGRNRDVRRDLSLGLRRDPRLRADPIAWATYLKSLVGGRRLKQRLAAWLSLNRRRDETCR